MAQHGITGEQLAYGRGRRYLSGLGVPQNNNEAIKQFKLAADKGHTRAMYYLGKILGEESLKNNDVASENEAAMWLQKAAERDDTDSEFLLGQFFEDGRGVEQSIPKAAHYYELAAEKGNSEAQLNIAEMYEEGRGVKRDLDKALKWYQSAASQGCEHAQFKCFQATHALADPNKIVTLQRLKRPRSTTF